MQLLMGFFESVVLRELLVIVREECESENEEGRQLGSGTVDEEKVEERSSGNVEEDEDYQSENEEVEVEEDEE